jgi:hypothetical protein
MSIENVAVCTTCAKTHPWPDGTVPKHPFNGGPPVKRKDDDTARTRHPITPTDRGISQLSMPFDPVLRMALIDAGVITSEQLTAAETKLNTITGVVTHRLREQARMEANERGQRGGG